MTDRIDPYWLKICQIITRHGHAVQAVFPEPGAPGFSYTVGLCVGAFGLRYEVIVFGLPPDTAHAILNSLAETVKSGAQIPIGEPLPPRDDGHPDRLNTWCSTPVVLRKCAPERARKYAYGAYRWAGASVDVVQLVLPDKEGRFPEDPDYDHHMLLCQPTLYKETP